MSFFEIGFLEFIGVPSQMRHEFHAFDFLAFLQAVVHEEEETLEFAAGREPTNQLHHPWKGRFTVYCIRDSSQKRTF